MNAAGQRWYSFLVDLAIRLHMWRPGPEEVAEHSRRVSFGTNVSRFPLKMTEFLRDRLRGKWLRIRK
jgi:hypothetical protein